MQVLAVTPSHLELRPDQVQACSGDEGGVWVIPQSSGGTGNEVVALESSFTVDPATGCSQSGSIDYATRLRDKMAWIETVVGPCGSYRDAAGHNVKRCYASDCSPVSTTDSEGMGRMRQRLRLLRLLRGHRQRLSEILRPPPELLAKHHVQRLLLPLQRPTCPPPTPQDSCDGLPNSSAVGRGRDVAARDAPLARISSTTSIPSISCATPTAPATRPATATTTGAAPAAQCRRRTTNDA